MASKRGIRRKQCLGKKQFPDQTAAVAAIRVIARNTGNQMHSYKCQWCHQWHIGHRGLDRLTAHARIAA